MWRQLVSHYLSGPLQCRYMGERCLGPLHVAIYTEIEKHTVIDRYIDSSYCCSCCCIDKTYCGVTSRYLAELIKYLGQGRKNVFY